MVTEERPELLLFCGLCGLLGNIAPLVLMAFATEVAQHDFVSDTVSDLARGPHKWIMDLGFYLNAGGLLALAIAAAHIHLGRMAWSLGIICLSLLALVVVLLGLWDEFHNSAVGPADWTIHTRLTLLLGPLYLAGPLLMAGGIEGVRRSYAVLFVASAVLWIVLATVFKLSPTAYDGIIEKIAIGATLLWTIPLSLFFLGRGWEKSHRLRTAEG
ncbi:DUF998 domain-containing protein [Histidinibacterium aquaticum]|uniref:DUF998 domain-containing protein n=1 Tax=Histidinibacterium aquaticum TaxID=2613962 RepID=UPI00168B6F43|nr:DUF998 domain-containing protein [Histidinibacterium aquaticum]